MTDVSSVMASPSSSGGQWLSVQIFKTIRGKYFVRDFLDERRHTSTASVAVPDDDWNLFEDSVSMLRRKAPN
jgi:hypothetical protein